MVRLVDLFRDDKDVLSVLLGFLNYRDYKILSSINHECAASPLRAQVFAHSIVRLPFPRVVDDHVDWSHYTQSTFLRGIKPAMLQHISSVSIPHSELANALTMLPFLDTVCIWSVPKQAIRDTQKGGKKDKRSHRRRREEGDARRATRQMRVSDFVGLTTLSELHLHRSDVFEFAMISELTNLTSIDMSNTRLENPADYKHLGSLVQLEKLILCDARLRSAAFLRKLVNLKWLDIEGTKISTVSDFHNLAKLEYLNIADIWIESGVVSLPNLKKLRQFLASYLASFAPVVVILDAPDLQKCDVRGSTIQDLAFLAGSPNLKTLDIRETRIIDLEIMNNLPNLKKLVLTANPQALRSVPWNILTQLDELHVEKWFAAPAEYEVIDGSFFSSLTSLHILQIEQMSDFSWIGLPGSSLKRLMMKTFTDEDEDHLLELAGCASLDTLHIRVQHRPPPFMAIHALSSTLVELRLVDAVAEDFSPIEECSKLEMLDLTVRETQTWRSLPRNVDFSFLRQLKKLRVLWLTGRHDFKDVAILTSLPKLEVLRLDKTRISDASPIAEITTLKQLSLDSTKVTVLPDLSKLTCLEAIGIPTGVDCSPFHVVGKFPMLYEIWHEEGYNCFWTGHGLDISGST